MQGWFWWVHTGGGAGRAHDAVVAGQRRLMIRRSEAQKLIGPRAASLQGAGPMQVAGLILENRMPLF